MASKSQANVLKKPKMSLKERRALKREKLAQETIPRRKRAAG
ncbi:Uncharacterised protein [Mycolicibacterium phlei]|jgi:hypothetical protein|nr:hypothetical protein MPHLCCUG_04481 [Mycolicibacterium phlei]STZ21727.1 Uncharacterised protein [Mycolicibacterium phlei]VEG11364.1 Uncharacterised protein [Mycobacteroides chelonae]